MDRSQELSPTSGSVTSGQSRRPDLNAPWSYVPSHIAEGPSEVRARDGWLICETCGDDFARFIAAAPELLAALEQIGKMKRSVADIDNRFTLQRAIHIARTALSKAVGTR